MKVSGATVLIIGFILLATVSSKHDFSPRTIQDILKLYVPDFEELSKNNNAAETLQGVLRSLSRRSNSSSRTRIINDDCISDPRLKILCGHDALCSPLESLLRAVNGSNFSVEESFGVLCPVLLFQSHRCLSGGSVPAGSARVDPSVPQVNQISHGTKQEQSVTNEKLITRVKPEPFKVWFYGMLSVTVISACSLTGLAVVPLMTRQLFSAMMNVFQGLAVGSLCGSALFHLIPQAFDLNKNDHLWKSLVVFCGIYFFYLSERFMKVIADRRNEVKNKIGLAAVASEEAGGLVDVHHHSHSHGTAKSGTIATVAWLIIFGDGMHNFIDGLSLGAAFSNSILSGISISVAVVCEEFPHELGDFAVLLGAGMSPRQAVLYNFLSALTCFLGLAVGILLGDLTEGAPAIFAFAGGMFLYISLVGMMGEINESLERVVGCSAQMKTLFLQNLGIVSGVVAMFVMAMYADNIDFEAFSVQPGDKVAIDETFKSIHHDTKSFVGSGL